MVCASGMEGSRTLQKVRKNGEGDGEEMTVVVRTRTRLCLLPRRAKREVRAGATAAAGDQREDQGRDGQMGERQRGRAPERPPQPGGKAGGRTQPMTTVPPLPAFAQPTPLIPRRRPLSATSCPVFRARFTVPDCSSSLFSGPGWSRTRLRSQPLPHLCTPLSSPGVNSRPVRSCYREFIALAPPPPSPPQKPPG